MNAGPRRERGIALLVALLTVALAAILIAGLLDRGELALARTRNALRTEQAQAYAQGLESYAAQILMKDLSDDSSVDTNTDIWALPLPPQQVPGGIISGTARDLNGCFNLNNLSRANTDNQAWKDVFVRLLKVQGVTADIADAVSEWLDDESGADSNDTYYLSLPVPYRRGRHTFAHVSELRLVRGVTSEVYAQLAPYVCALPPGTKINVNTASVPVLQSLGDDISKAKAESLWQNGQAHWTGTFKQQWQQQDILIDPHLGQNQLGSASSYFLARGDITLDGIPFTFYSLIERRIGPGGGIRVLERSRGSDDALVAPVVPEQGGTSAR
jgi:general secretion pathway protein K